MYLCTIYIILCLRGVIFHTFRLFGHSFLEKKKCPSSLFFFCSHSQRFLHFFHPILNVAVYLPYKFQMFDPIAVAHTVCKHTVYMNRCLWHVCVCVSVCFCPHHIFSGDIWSYAFNEAISSLWSNSYVLSLSILYIDLDMLCTHISYTKTYYPFSDVKSLNF